MGRRTTLALLLGIVLGCGASRADDWPTIRHDPGHGGLSSETIRGPYRVAWARTFGGEVVATAAEPIVAGGRAYVGTEAGRLWALDARTGAPLWRADGDGPILHAAAVADGTVFFGAAGRHLFALDAADGHERWRFRSGPGGFGTAPVVAGGRVLVGGRDGRLYALDAADGRLAWTVETGGPIRTTAAVVGERVLFASEDMHAYAADLRSGRLLWRSAKLPGQSLRDVYPVVLGDVAIFRTNPVVSMPERIAADREVLIRAAGVEAATWQVLDRWLKGPGPRGTAEQFDAEQAAILDHLEREPAARTFSALDVATGREGRRFPVLWAAGCQGVGAPPVQTSHGPVVLWRTMYSNWNLGVAPLVGLGFLDLGRGRVRPIFHEHGSQPPWNTFWGTADESQNFSAAGETLIIAHQSTLSAFDLATRRLEPIAGTRDSWGGYPGVPGVRNEWNGPARGAAAIAAGRLYWLTGSRLIAIEAGSRGPTAEPPEPEPVSPGPHPPVPREAPGRDELRRRLAEQVAAYLEGAPWAPLYVDPGIGGREFFFDHSSDAFRALSLAHAHLPEALRKRVERHLAEQWRTAPPYSRDAAYPLDCGRRRELFDVPEARLRRVGPAPGPSLGWLDAVALYAESVAGWEIVEEPGAWEGIRAVFDAADADPISPAERNRALAGLLAMRELASRTGHEEVAAEAARRAGRLRAQIVEVFRRGAGSLAAESIPGVARIDELIGRGDAIWTRLGGHKSKITLFLGLTPRGAEALAPEVAGPARADLDFIDRTMPTWFLAWGERPAHTGENFIDYPDNVLGIFAAQALLGEPGRRAGVGANVDVPWCEGDLFSIEKLALALGRP
jgi:outer membrane protein assembly factor BamB